MGGEISHGRDEKYIGYIILVEKRSYENKV
jgi:hypothetical protein